MTDALDLTVQGPLAPACPALLVISGGQDWRPLQTCSLLTPTKSCHLMATEAHMVSKGAVSIPLECCLVHYISISFKYFCLKYKQKPDDR